MRQYFFLGVLLFFPVVSAHAALFDPPSNIERIDQAITRYESYAKKGPWPKIKEGKKIEPGQTSDRLPTIRDRLEAEGYFKELKKKNQRGKESSFYDPELEEVIKVYQERNGLEPDGVIGKGTFQAMNVTVDRRLCQLRVNRSRFESLMATEIPPRYVRVNVPAFRLDVVENHQSVLESKVIVGRRDRKTPIFNDEITHLVMNPAWYVPRNIAVKDKLPHLQKDPAYLQKMNMKLYGKSEEGTSVEVDPATIDWTTVSADNFDYKIVQKPGGGNALGTIKFLFPNKYDVYLHDTSDRYLFKRQSRSFSSGCIRVERYMDLADIILKDNADWNHEKIGQAINSGIQRRIDLTTPLPIHIVYVTAWVTEGGEVQFRDDLYRYDPAIAKTVCSQ